MKKTVTFSGGFHNSSPITLHMNFGADLDDYKEGRIELKELVRNNLTPYQSKRLDKHFCGIQGCTCGGWFRADIDIDNL